jgi:hypothetical protein
LREAPLIIAIEAEISITLVTNVVAAANVHGTIGLSVSAE